MSGDVQPRKRKDKKKKRDDEASHGVHLTKLGSDDVLLHIQEDHGTGGHWCAKVIFFSLMALLLGLVCLIILENRGLSNVDTPLSESRFSNYFDGWVDERRDDHDDHHDSHGSLEHDDHEADEEHDGDDHDEPFEEEADHSEGEEEEEAEAEDDNVTPEEEEEDGDNATTENVTVEEEDDEEEDEDVDNLTIEENDNVTAEDENVTGEDDNVTQETTKEQNEEEEDDDDGDANNTNEDDDNATKETSNPTSQATPDDEDDPFDEDDEDGVLDSLEKIVDNDAAELELLKEKARQQAAAESKQNTASDENNLDDEANDAPSWASSLTIKIGIGLALALVARLVLIRKKPISNENEVAEILMKRRLTIATAEENIPGCAKEVAEPLPEEDEYSEEEIEIEEEIEYIEEEEAESAAAENQIDAGDNDYLPETFEQLNALYRPKDKNEESVQKNETKPLQTETFSYSSPYNTISNNNNNRNQNNNANSAQNEISTGSTKSWTSSGSKEKNTSPIKIQTPQIKEEVQTKPNVSLNYSPPKETTAKSVLPNQPIVKKEVTYDLDYENFSKEKPVIEHKKETTHDMDYQPDADDIDYDEDDIYDDEDDDEEQIDSEDLEDDDEEDLEEGDDEDVSDIDDAELMSRLEAKYGKLPAKEYESDEDPDDPTWTQIKPKTGGGPQSVEDGDNIDLFEEELLKARNEMLRERYDDALLSYQGLIKKYPNNPRVYLGSAQTYENYAKQRNSNHLLKEAVGMYGKYLAMNVEEYRLEEYRETAEHYVEILQFLGLYEKTLSVYHMMLKKFPNDKSILHKYAIAFLTLDKLKEGKLVLEYILKLWPEDGLAMANYGFVLKQLDQDFYNAVIYLRRAIDSKHPDVQNGRFYLLLGETLQRMGRGDEAFEIFSKGADLKFYPSMFQRSLYNVAKLKTQHFWTIKETSYEKYFKKLQDNWLAIKAEGLYLLTRTNKFYEDRENLVNTGEWKELLLFRRGSEIRENCLKAPITCSLINQFPAARDCKRGQVKFSVLDPGTHIWPHCGPTNCRLRAHLGLVVPNNTRLRVAGEERSWQEGEFLIFDDSFEHEVWNEGHDFRLVLIVDVWHPDLTESQRHSLVPI